MNILKNLLKPDTLFAIIYASIVGGVFLLVTKSAILSVLGGLFTFTMFSLFIASGRHERLIESQFDEKQ